MAQSTEVGLKARLIEKPLYLRGGWHDNKLNFDSAGQLLGTSAPFSFVESGVLIKSVKLSDKHLRLDGERVGLEFTKDSMTRRPLDESIRIEIAVPQSGDYTAALDSVFTADIADFEPMLPSFWQGAAFNHVLLLSHHDVEPIVPEEIDSRIARVGGGVSAPKVLFVAEPLFTKYALAAKVSGKILVHFQVGRDGLPTKIRLLKPLGMGLDEQAVVAVSHYRFKPAEQNGQPVAVEMNVEVNFQSF